MRVGATLATIFAMAVLVILALQMNTARGAVVTEGLVSYWTLDEGDIEGDTVKDVWGENDGTIIGDPQIVGGKVNQALEFDGQENYVLVAVDPSLNFTGAFTLEAWVMTSFSGARQAVISNRDGKPWYTLNIDPGYLMLSIHDGGGAVDVKPSDVNISDGEWHHFVGTMDNTDANGAKIYVDGDLVGDVSTNAPPTDMIPFELPRDTAIGGDPTGGKLFNGIIDEARIYNRSLSEDEIVQNMNASGLAVVRITNRLALTWGAIKSQSSIP